MAKHDSERTIYANHIDCGKCKYYDREHRVCDYYLLTGLHRNEDEPVSRCSVRKSERRKASQGFDLSQTVSVYDLSQIPPDFYSVVDIASVTGQPRQFVSKRIETMRVHPEFRYIDHSKWRTFFSAEKSVRVALSFRDVCPDPSSLPERLRGLRNLILKRAKDSFDPPDDRET